MLRGELVRVAKRVTPHTAVTSSPGLSLGLGGGCPGDEPGLEGMELTLRQ